MKPLLSQSDALALTSYLLFYIFIGIISIISEQYIAHYRNSIISVDFRPGIKEFDEALAKTLIEKIAVSADRFTAEFKSGITINIEA